MKREETKKVAPNTLTFQILVDAGDEIVHALYDYNLFRRRYFLFSRFHQKKLYQM
jgi:hypothetical protein